MEYMSYYQASGLLTTRHPRGPAERPNGDIHEPFLNYLFSQQVLVKPRIDLFTKTKFMELKQRRINRR